MSLTLKEYIRFKSIEDFPVPLTRENFIRLRNSDDQTDKDLFERFCTFMNTPEIGGYEGLVA